MSDDSRDEENLDNILIASATEDDTFYSLENPAYDDDENILDWGWMRNCYNDESPEPELSPSPPPPTPPPRSSSITEESPKKAITIVVHMVQTSPQKSPHNSLDFQNLNTYPENFIYPETSRSFSPEHNYPGNSSETSPENPEITRTLSPAGCSATNFNFPENFTYPETTRSFSPEHNCPGSSSATNFNLVDNLENTRRLSPEPNGPGSSSATNFNFPDFLSNESETSRNYQSNSIDNNLIDNNNEILLSIPNLIGRNEISSESSHTIIPRQRLPDLLENVHSDGVLSSSLRHQQQDKAVETSVHVGESTSQVDMSTQADMSTTSQHSDYQQLQTQSDNDDSDSGFLPRFVRASMRRVRRFRLSTRNSREVENLDNTQSTIVVEQSNSDDVDNDSDQNNENENEDSSDVSSTITDRISESAPDLPPPRQRRASPGPRPRGSASSPPSPRPAPSPLGTWPYDTCFALAALGCTAGLFNLSRFAVNCVQFGGPFLIQFLLLSALFGVPLFLFHVALGHYLGAGVMDMWRISPVFQGVGIALLAGQALIGLYSIVGVSWLFVFFRDSFVTRATTYKWAQPFPLYRGADISSLGTPNQTSKLEETVPDYFSGVVLQRYNLSSPDRSFGHFKFQVAFNLAVVWMIVFVSLSKGLKSYGRVVFVVVGLPVVGIFILCCQLFNKAAATSQGVFPETAWEEIISNTQSWIAAATEVFFTWGLLGIASMQAASQVQAGRRLLRDSMIVAVVTLTILVFVAFLADACNQLLLDKGYLYVHTSSFEHMSTAQFLKPLSDGESEALRTMVSTRQVPHSSLLAGSRLVLPGSSSKGRRSLSGYQALRLATELLPATFAAVGIRNLSVFWAIAGFFSLILFGVAQQLAVWHSVITGIIAINARSLKSWETTITFFTCAFGYILGLPLTTELGIWVVYFLDTVVGSGWWLALLHCLLMVAVLVIRGRPYNGETLAGSLFGGSDEDHGNTWRGCNCGLRGWFVSILSFVWSVILPIILLVLSVVLFRTSESGELYDWSTVNDRLYWPVWARELGSILQLLPVLVVPLVAMVQTCRYLANGPPDLFDRIELLYRPAPWGGRQRSSTDLFSSVAAEAGSGVGLGGGADDPPPKYTPPPSYTTATGARIAKLLRESIRRSMRRLAPSTSALAGSSSHSSEPPPPDYAAVLVEMRRSSVEHSRNIMTAQEVAHILRSSFRRTREQNRPVSSELLEIRPSLASHTLPARSKTLTAPEVAQILRSGSLRRSRRYQQPSTSGQQISPVATIKLDHDGSSSST